MELTQVIIRLLLVSLVPAGCSIGTIALQKETKFGKLPWIWQQVIIGIFFGLIAIFGTEVGVDVGGAKANIRDAGPLCAGLIFGGPAGIIAGVIGATERLLITVIGHRSSYTVVACTISTLLAGFYAAALRKFMFDDKRPSWGFGFAIGMVMEVIHLTILLITKVNDLEESFRIIRILAVAMIFTNGLALMIPCLVAGIISKKKHNEKGKAKKITSKIQVSMLIAVACTYLVTSSFFYWAQTNTSLNDAEETLSTNLIDVQNDVKASTEADIKTLTYAVKDVYIQAIDNHIEINKNSLIQIANASGAEEISVISKVNGRNIVVASTALLEGMDMDDSDINGEFNCLMEDAEDHKDFYIQAACVSSMGEIVKYAGFAVDSSKQADTYVQVGYKYMSYSAVVNKKIDNLSLYRHVGSTGKIIVADNEHLIRSEGDTIRTLERVKLDTELSYNEMHKCKIDLDGTGEVECFIMYDFVEYYYVISAITASEVTANRDNMIYFFSFMEIIVLAILFFIIYKLLMNLVVDKINLVNSNLEKITSGDLSVVLNVEGSKELQSLSNGINSTVMALKNYIDEASHRIDEELRFAKSIQLSALPNTYPAFPKIKTIDIGARMFTAKEVGGDFYDYFIIDDKRIGFLIADVSGKGIPAAMFMMQSKALLKNYAMNLDSPADILSSTNEELCKENDAGMFLTCWFGIIDVSTGLVKFANAGHNPPVLYRNEIDQWGYLKCKPGFILAGIDSFKYTEEQIQLNKGDKIFLYTDGVTEARRSDGELYREPRLKDYLNNNKTQNILQNLDGLKQDIDNFAQEEPQFDDITMLMIEFK